MSRSLIVAGAQLGPIQRADGRARVVRRLVELLGEAHGRGARLVVFPELALTTFFPRWAMDDPAEIDAFFEAEMPGPQTAPLFAEAARLGVGFHLGYAELARDGERLRRFNTAILVDGSGGIVGKYRKVHLPGHLEVLPDAPFQHLEKRYFAPGDLGFPVWRAFGGLLGMCICNDRRWPETYRVMGLQGVELIVLGYNTPTHLPWMPLYDHLSDFHNHLCLQSGAYQNSTFVVAVAKAGCEEGSELLGGSCIVAPSGEIIAMSATRDDEIFSASCDLDLAAYNKKHVFNFALHRRIEHYGLITAQTGVVLPP